MNSLEFIEKLILEKKTDIVVHKEILLRDDSKKNFHNKVIKESEESINILNKIKTELEAWKVCKEFIVNLGGEYKMSIDSYYNVNEYKTLEKVLEVEDE